MSSPIVSAPDTKFADYSLQPQSHFFRLPRELRDLIYESYSFEPSGCRYHYNGGAGRLQTGHGCPIDINLAYTCKAIANVIRGVAFRVNTITFTPADRTTAYAFKSAALRFKRLQDITNATKWRVVLATAQSLMPEARDEIQLKHQSSGQKLLDILERLLGPQDRYAKCSLLHGTNEARHSSQ